MKTTIRKYTSWQEVEHDRANYWKGKSSQERLKAMRVLIDRFFIFNPRPSPNGRPFPDIYPIVKR